MFLTHFSSLEEAALKLHGDSSKAVVVVESMKRRESRPRDFDGETIFVLDEDIYEDDGLRDGTLFSRMPISKRKRRLGPCPQCLSFIVITEGDIVTVCRAVKCGKCLRATCRIPVLEYDWVCNMATTCTCNSPTPCVYIRDKIMIEDQPAPSKEWYYIHANPSGVEVRQKMCCTKKKVEYDRWKLLDPNHTEQLLKKTFSSRIIPRRYLTEASYINAQCALRRIRHKEQSLFQQARATYELIPYASLMHFLTPGEDWWEHGCIVGLDGMVAAFTDEEKDKYVYVYQKQHEEEEESFCIPFIPKKVRLNFCIDYGDPVPFCLFYNKHLINCINQGPEGWRRYSHVKFMHKCKC